MCLVEVSRRRELERATKKGGLLQTGVKNREREVGGGGVLPVGLEPA